MGDRSVPKALDVLDHVLSFLMQSTDLADQLVVVKSPGSVTQAQGVSPPVSSLPQGQAGGCRCFLLGSVE